MKTSLKNRKHASRLALPKWLCADLSTNMLNPFTEKDGLCELPQLRNESLMISLQLAFFRRSRLNYDSIKCSYATQKYANINEVWNDEEFFIYSPWYLISMTILMGHFFASFVFGQNWKKNEITITNFHMNLSRLYSNMNFFCSFFVDIVDESTSRENMTKGLFIVGATA